MGQSTLDSLRKENAVIIGKVANGNLTFHPLFNSLSVEREIAALIYGEGLLTLDDSGTAIEGLAYLPVKLSDGLDWIFRLKQGVVFHDGEPLTSEDVIFTYMQYKASRVYDPIFHRYFQNIHDLSALDSQTVRFVMKSPIDVFPKRLAGLPILPRHQLDRGVYADAGELLETTRPIGLGPYEIESWPVYDTVTLKANETWHRGRAKLDKVIYQFYPTSEALQAAFIVREVDLIEVERDGTLRDLKRARSDAKIQAIVPENRAFSAIFYNHYDPLMSQSVIRRALTYATNRDRILEDVLVPGTGVLAHSPIHPSFRSKGGAFGFDYSPREAIELLRLEGWLDSDDDGFLDKAGQTLRFELLFPRGQASAEKAVRVIKLNLNHIGIQVVPIPITQKELIQRLGVGSYEAAFYVQDFEPTPDDLYAVFHSESIGLGNMLGYSSRQVDRNINFLFGLADPERIEPVYKQLEMLLIRDQPCMFLYFVDTRYVAYDPSLRDLGKPGQTLRSPDMWYRDRDSYSP
tara:strand:- start:29574 stop:31127 length:1554 start_codon:yes stop_codon:yes gene_type:complete